MTRCQILVEGSDVVIYRHTDGYPEGNSGVLSVLLPVVKEFKKWRGEDPPYLTAHVSAAFVIWRYKWYEDWVARNRERNPDYQESEETRYLSNGLDAFTGEFQGDVSFIYVVRKNHVEVRVPTWGVEEEPTLANTKLELAVDFEGKPYTVV